VVVDAAALVARRGAMMRAVAIAALAACSGNNAHVDANGTAGDASFLPAPCAYTFGRTYTLSQVEFEPAGMGFDIDGDGTIDNAFAFIAPIANQVVDDNIHIGSSRYLFDIEGWDAPPADDSAAKMIAFAGFDADQPPDPSNDFTVGARYDVPLRDFDVACHPLNISRDGTITSDVLQIHSDRWNLFVANVGNLEFADITLRFTMSSDLSTADGLMGAVMTSCAMSRAYLPQVGAGTMLGLMLQNGHQPDIDVDGDGKETLDFSNGQITACHDGDGTVISGPLCACDPRIADGYSLAVSAHGINCQIVGVIDPQ
jgi:hypothetical protein